MTSADILKALASDSIEPTPELFATAAKDPAVLERLAEIAGRAASNPKNVFGRDVNVASWAAYVFAENGDRSLAKPLYAMLDLPADAVRKFAGAYADFDLPIIFLRLAGKDVTPVFGQLVQTYGGAAEVRVAPLRAAAAAWAHGLISRREALLPFIDELGRMCDEGYADIQDDEWFDTLLDAALEIGPAGLEDSLEALREYWNMQDDWDAELAEATLDETVVKERLQTTYPLLHHAMDFIARWDDIDAAEEES